MLRRSLLVVPAAVLGLAAVAVAELPVPKLERRVTDQAGLLTTDAARRIEASLAQLESDTGAQVAVLTVPSLRGEPLADYSMRVAEAWQLGRGKQDDGVLLLVARDERRIRIEVGYGLEATLTDLECGRIIDNVLRPAFRGGDFAGGIERAVDVIGGEIRGTATAPESPPAGPPMSTTQGAFAVLVFLLVVGVFSLAGVFTRGCVGWFMYLFLLPFWGGFSSAFLGPRTGAAIAVAWLVLYPIARLWLWRTGGGRRFRSSHPGWIVVSSGRGGGFGGGGFSGGGFSGGGGSFGGGGASGGW